MLSTGPVPLSGQHLEGDLTVHVEVLGEGQRLHPIAGMLCPTSLSKDFSFDMGEKQTVPEELLGKHLMSQYCRGQGCESALER